MVYINLVKSFATGHRRKAELSRAKWAGVAYSSGVLTTYLLASKHIQLAQWSNAHTLAHTHTHIELICNPEREREIKNRKQNQMSIIIKSFNWNYCFSISYSHSTVFLSLLTLTIYTYSLSRFVSVLSIFLLPSLSLCLPVCTNLVNENSQWHEIILCEKCVKNSKKKKKKEHHATRFLRLVNIVFSSSSRK